MQKSLSSSGMAAPALHVDVPQVPVYRGNSRDTTPDSGCISSKPDDDVKFSIGEEFDHDGRKNAVQVSSESSVTRHDLTSERKAPLTFADIVNNFIGANSSTSSMPSPSSEIGVDEDVAREVTPGNYGTSACRSFHQNVIDENSTAAVSSAGLALGSSATSAEQARNEEVFPSRSRKKGRKRQNQRQTAVDGTVMNGGNTK